MPHARTHAHSHTPRPKTTINHRVHREPQPHRLWQLPNKQKECIQSNQKGGYTQAMLEGNFSEEQEKAIEKVRKRAEIVADRQATKRSLENLGTEEYDVALEAVSRQIRELRVVLEQQEAKDREREWVANQVTGELDDNKLVDGVTGDCLSIEFPVISTCRKFVFLFSSIAEVFRCFGTASVL